MHTNLNRFQAFAIHLLISSVILGSFLAFVYFVWYPQPFFVVEGLEQIVWVLVGVDLILGPALTLVVYKTGKPGLKRDLSIIALIQIIGFAYGAHTMYTERPYYAVMYDSVAFEVVAASEMKLYNNIEPEKLPSFFEGPSIVYAEAPKEMEKLKSILEEMKKGGASIGRNPEFFKPLKGLINRKFKYSVDLSLYKNNSEKNKVILSFKEKYKEKLDDFIYLKFIGKITSVLLVIDKESEEIVDYIDISSSLQN